jgi:hypothetical protein
MNASKDAMTPGGFTPEDWEKIRGVFEPMREKFARIAATLPAEARPAVRFEALVSEETARS